MNGYSQLLIAVYLLIVLARKNEVAFYDALSQEGGFIKWAVALFIVVSVAKRFGEAGDKFMVIVYTAMILVAVGKNKQMFANINKVLES